MMNVLGISAFGHGSAAGLVRDGRVIAAAEEERFSRTLKDSSLPRRAVRFCLTQGGVTARDVDAWVFYEKPLRRFERVLAGQLAAFPRSSRSFARELFAWLGERLWLKTLIASEFGVDPARVFFCDHQLAHAAGAFFLSPFDDAAVLIVGGANEWATTSLARAGAHGLEILAVIDHPHSLALASRAVARFLGFPAAGGERLIEALAAHGEPHRAEELRRFVRVGNDGHFELDRAAFTTDLGDGLVCGPAWIEAFGAPRLSTSPLHIRPRERGYSDLAASFQCVLEEALLALVRELHRRVPSRHLCLSGAVAQNAAAVARVAKEGLFAELFLPPDCGDAGAALGAALHAHSQLSPGSRRTSLADARLGEAVLRDPRVPGAAQSAGETIEHEERRLEHMLAALTDGRTVGWMRGRAEFGPLTLGQRVVLADPRRADMAERVSRSVVRREEFLPFSPALPAERAEEFFEIPSCAQAPARLRQILLRGKPPAHSAAPAALGVDGRARAHLVDVEHDRAFHRLLTRFGERTGAPLLLSTALATRGEPPIRSERDGLAFFERSALDLLVVEERVYSRS